MVEAMTSQRFEKIEAHVHRPDDYQYGFALPSSLNVVPKKVQQEQQKVKFIGDKLEFEFRISSRLDGSEARQNEINKILKDKGFAYKRISEYHEYYSDANGNQYYTREVNGDVNNIGLYKIPSVKEFEEFIKENKYTVVYDYQSTCPSCWGIKNRLEDMLEEPKLSQNGVGFVIVSDLGFSYFKRVPSGISVYNNDGWPIAQYSFKWEDPVSNLVNFLKEEAPALDYSEALRRNPKDASAYVNRGDAKIWLRDSDGAMEDYNTAIDLLEKSTGSPAQDKILAKAYLHRADLMNGLENYKSQIADLTKAIGIDPNNAKTYENRGFANYRLNHYKKAISDLDMAITLDSKNVKYYYMRARIKRDYKDYTGAIDDYGRVIEHTTDNVTRADAYSYRANCKAAIGDRKGANEDVKMYKTLMHEN
ncbi:MAG: hypothetical protein NTX79_04660 [Candidatus Micrarchaeota archaeon]|nr:hypothetical protein [Candidatus Micrarchaeota archaeon]